MALTQVDGIGDVMRNLRGKRDEVEEMMKEAGRRVKGSAEHMEQELEKSKREELEQEEKDRR